MYKSLLYSRLNIILMNYVCIIFCWTGCNKKERKGGTCMLEKGRKGTKEREEKGGYEDLRVIQKKLCNFISKYSSCRLYIIMWQLFGSHFIRQNYLKAYLKIYIEFPNKRRRSILTTITGNDWKCVNYKLVESERVSPLLLTQSLISLLDVILYLRIALVDCMY